MSARPQHGERRWSDYFGSNVTLVQYIDDARWAFTVDARPGNSPIWARTRWSEMRPPRLAWSPTKTAKIERIDRVLDAEVSRVRLSDGGSIRMRTETARLLLEHTNAVIVYDVDAVGNRYNPRPAGPVKS